MNCARSISVLLTLGAIAAPATAQAAISPTDDAGQLAQALVADSSTVAPGSTLTGTANDQGPANAVVGNPLAGFPTNPGTFALLTTGDPSLADDPNDGESTGRGNFPYGTNAPNQHLRGQDFDTSVLRVNVNVPAGRNCLALDYRFLSEEFPEFVQASFNDTFVAEVDATDWRADGDSETTAPHDFATGSGRVDVDGLGPTAVSPAQAAGTTYDAASALVTTKTPITPGAHSVYLSIFDRGDRDWDSAVMLDNLRFVAEGAGTCQPPHVTETVPPGFPADSPAAATMPKVKAPSNAFAFRGKPVFGAGSTTLSVTVPGPGVLAAQDGSASASVARRKKAKRATLVKPVRVSVKKAGLVRLTIKPTVAGRKVLRRRKRLSAPVRISFTPAGGRARTVVKSVTIKARAPRRKR